MLPTELYNLIIEEEKKGVHVTNLNAAAKSVAKAYSKNALKKGATYVNYNEPEYRCAYLYKYSTIHTRFVTKFFRKISKKKVVRDALFRKKDIKISSLGGGPGTDIVGIFKALAVNPHMHQRISQANVLDLCVGWHHPFNYIVSNLINGNVKDIPSSFVKDNFQANFIEVDLLQPLPTHVMETISNADIICMVKFISAVLGKETFPTFLKALANLFKVGAIILFIDNFKGNVAESMEIISCQAGLEIVLGPEIETIVNNTKFKKDIFYCEPMKATRVTVIGLMKTAKSKISINLSNPSLNSMLSNKENNIYEWNVGNTNFLGSSILIDGNSAMESSRNLSYPNVNYDKYTQTENSPENKEGSLSEQLQELSPLITTLSELLAVVTQLKPNQCCCYCRLNNQPANISN